MKIKKAKINDLSQINSLEKTAFKDDAFSEETIEQLIHNHTFFLKIVNNYEKIIGYKIVLEQ